MIDGIRESKIIEGEMEQHVCMPFSGRVAIHRDVLVRVYVGHIYIAFVVAKKPN
jgi:uncharacterized membrane protein